MNFVKNKRILLFVIGTFLALIPSYIMRFSESTYMWMYNNLKTYPGDLWNFFTNYIIAQHAKFPPEYPAGLRFFYEVMQFYRYENYSLFFTVNFLIIAFFACATTYLLIKIMEVSGQISKLKNIIWFWILAPSFIIYATLNYDAPVVFLIVLSLYLFFKKKFSGSIIALAAGTVLKIFPVFLLPIILLKCPKEKRLNLFLLFLSIVFVLNLPYMLSDFSAWIFPYTWQITDNLSKTPESGTYWWIMYKSFGNWSGAISLILYAVLYFITVKKFCKTSLVNLGIAVVLLFLLTDRIYSPQYNLYLLPFLTLASYKINKKAFYLLEIINIFIIIFLFNIRAEPARMQILTFIKYSAIIWLFVENWKVMQKEINPLRS